LNYNGKVIDKNPEISKHKTS